MEKAKNLDLKVVPQSFIFSRTEACRGNIYVLCYFLATHLDKFYLFAAPRSLSGPQSDRACCATNTGWREGANQTLQS